jgi:creatine kinase
MSGFENEYGGQVAPCLAGVEEWIKPGLGDAEYICAEKGATFPCPETPAQMPDLSKHTNYMSEVLRANPEIYNKLKNRVTSTGITLAKCIKTGVDNPGHPNIKTVGMVAGDEEAYTVFKELFDPVIAGRHNGYPANGVQPTDLNINNLLDLDIDPYNKYVLTSRVRTGRSIRGFQLPPSISFEERRKLENAVVSALKTMTGDLQGDYFPLAGSKSYAEKPQGMSKQKQEELLDAGNLFQEPDSTLLLCSGMARHWPDSRGIFHNNQKNLFVWLNEEDHMRIVSMQKGKNIKEVTARFIRSCDVVQNVLKSQGLDFMHNQHLGWVLTCPSNLGTGLRAGSLVKIPLMSSNNNSWNFKDLVFSMGLQSRGKGGVDALSSGGIYDISNKDRIGKSETDLVNTMMRGVRQFVEWEKMMEEGQAATVEKEVNEVMGMASNN